MTHEVRIATEPNSYYANEVVKSLNTLFEGSGFVAEVEGTEVTSMSGVVTRDYRIVVKKADV